MKREHFSSRLGFILITAACSIGLGNVWRFPYITGLYGGASFVLLYIAFLLILSLPIVVMEFAVGRASQQSTARSFDILEPAGSKWHWFKYVSLAGNYLLMMFYTVITGWLLWYFTATMRGRFQELSPEAAAGIFDSLLADPVTMFLYTVVTIAVSALICAMGIQNGVERITKWMMIALFSLLLVLAANSILLPGAEKGLAYYLLPDFGRMMDIGLSECVFGAMGQAFFTLSVGVGTLSVFGSRIDKSSSLTENALYMAVLDTLVAIISGLIIFPACASFGIQPDSGPNLLFVTLPNVFNGMEGGRLWGSLFFLFMCFAALTTVIAVIENIMTWHMDYSGWSRKRAAVTVTLLLSVLVLPCVLGFNVWADIQPLGEGSNILALEDFIMSNNLLPMGSLVFLAFCTRKCGWGWDNFYREACDGKGLPYPRSARGYVTHILPVIILIVLAGGYLSM